MRRDNRFRLITLGLLLLLAGLPGAALAAPPPSASGPPLLVLGPGDQVNLHVFGQPAMDGVMYVGDDGTVQIPLAGNVSVAGLSPTEAARKVEKVLKDRQYLRHPHVTFTIMQSRSQQVSVLGEVAKPGVYQVQSNTTLLNLLAQAGGETSAGADTVDILRTGQGGTVQRLKVDLRGLAESGATPEAAEITVRGGDQVYVPRAPIVYVAGEVRTPGAVKLDPGMTVLQAIVRAGGVTELGSTHRIVIKRVRPDGSYQNIGASVEDKVQANDVVTVKERIF